VLDAPVCFFPERLRNILFGVRGVLDIPLAREAHSSSHTIKNKLFLSLSPNFGLKID
jgi:hypothetical protein